MHETRIRFVFASRPEAGLIDFQIEVGEGAGASRTGSVRSYDPEGFPSPVLLTDELVGGSPGVIQSAVFAALSGPYRSALQLRPGERIDCGAVAVATVLEPPAPGFTAVRILWESGTDSSGIIVTYRPTDPGASREHDRRTAPSGSSLLGRVTDRLRRWLGNR